MEKKIRHLHQSFIEAMELALSVLIIIGLVIYTWFSIVALSALDWHLTSTYEEFVQRALFAMIGIELLQIIRVQALKDIVLISILLLVRKALMPDSTAAEMIALTVTSAIILVAWQILSRKEASSPSQ